MTQPENQINLDIKEIPEAAIAYLNSIEDSLSILTSHIKNKELTEAEETISLITEDITELRTLFLEQTERKEL